MAPLDLSQQGLCVHCPNQAKGHVGLCVWQMCSIKVLVSAIALNMVFTWNYLDSGFVNWTPARKTSRETRPWKGQCARRNMSFLHCV